MICETRYDEIGFTRPGAWAEQLVVPAAQLHVLAGDADLRSAAALEPAACPADAATRASVRSGERVAVIGGGTIGRLAVQLVGPARQPRSSWSTRASHARATAPAPVEPPPLSTRRRSLPCPALSTSSSKRRAPTQPSRWPSVWSGAGPIVLAGIPDPEDGARRL